MTGFEQDTGRPIWSSKIQQLFFFLGYCVDMRSFCNLIYEDRVTNPDAVPSFLQTILVCTFIGGPLIFLQIFIGQFTQRGCIAIGSMVPAMYGFGYCMMVVGVINCALNVFFTGTSLLYIFVSLLNFPYPAWMYCSAEMYEKYPNCFSRSAIDLCYTCSRPSDDPCFKAEKDVFSAELYYYMVAFEKDSNITDPFQIGKPMLKSLAHLFFAILLIYIISCRKLKSLDWSIRISLIFCLLAMLGTSVSTLANKYVWKALSYANVMRLSSLGNMQCWMAAFRRVTEALKISLGGHVYLGSYMSFDTQSHFRAVYLVGYYIIIIILFHLHYILFEILMECKLNAHDLGIADAEEIAFVLMPTKLGLTATPQLWCTLHFTIFFLLSVVSTVLEIIIIDETITEEFKIGDYYIYTRCVICIIIFLMCLPMTTLGGFLIVKSLTQELKIINLLVITFIFVVVFLYNIQRLKDDIHFVLNTPPTWYVQTCWIATAFVTGIQVFLMISKYSSLEKVYMVSLPMHLLLGLPILIGFFAKLAQYLKQRNITGMFRPSIHYGAPDLITRLMRLLYNPRLEVRYRRRKEACKHHCLLNNKIALMAVEKELLLLQRVVFDLRSNESYEGENREIINEILHHYRVISSQYSQRQVNLRTTWQINP